MATDPKPAEVKPPRTLLVRATKLGFYPDPGEMRQRARSPGETFMLRSEAHFAGPDKGAFQWMEWADQPTTVVPITEPVSIMSVPARLTQDPLRPGDPSRAPVPAIKP